MAVFRSIFGTRYRGTAEPQGCTPSLPQNRGTAVSCSRRSTSVNHALMSKKLPLVIAVCIQKGGVGKTTTSVNLAAALAERGRRVLLLDLDPQGQASDHFGMRAIGAETPMLRVLQGSLSIADAAQPTPFKVDVIAGGQALAAAEPMLQAEAGGEMVLRERLEEMPADRWDTIILDCPPSLGALNLSALAAANLLLVPLPLNGADLDGLGLLSRTMEQVRRRINPGLKLLGILPNKVGAKTVLSRHVLDDVERHFPGSLFEQTIRQDTRIAEAYSYKCPVTSHAPKSNGAKDYRALAGEVMNRVNAMRGAA